MSKLYYDVAVIGGGVIGTSITYFLSKYGFKVLLIEEKNLNSGASGACDEGIILQSKSSGIMLDLVMESAKIYKNLSKELEYDIGYRNVGGMILIKDEKYIPAIENIVDLQRKRGLKVSMLDYHDTHSLQEGLSKKVIASVYNKDDSSVYPFKLTLAYMSKAEKLGGNFLPHNRVMNISINNGKVEKIVTKDHEIYAPVVINAAGNAARAIGKLAGIDIPVFPIKGHLIITEQIPYIIHSQIMDAKFIMSKHKSKLPSNSTADSKYNVGFTLSQAPTGNLIIGGNRENAGYDTSTSFAVIGKILKEAVDFFPFFKEVSVIRTFAGLRPSTPDSLPILSETEISGFYVAAGLGGDGLSLSPIVGKIMCELITNGKSNIVDLDKLKLERFKA